jgi:hypothetical protein
VAAALGALLCLRARRPLWLRILAVTALTAAAALAKEVAFVLPLLALLLVRRRDERALPIAMLLVVAGVFAGRYAAIGGIGGYSSYPWTPLRMIGAAGSYALASTTPPSVPAFHFQLVFLVPAAVLALAAWRLRVLWKRRDEAVRLVGVGFVWFVVAILPLLSLPVDLNNANGERNLLLASVGLALALAGLLPPLRFPTTGVAVAAGLAGALALSLYSSFDWIDAGRLTQRLVPVAEALAPPGGELVLLSAPESYRTAHVFTGGDLSEVLDYRGRTGFTTAICVPVNVRVVRSGEIRFRASGGAYDGATGWGAPFDFPVLHSSGGLTGECSYSRLPGGPEPPGLGLRALAGPAPSQQPVVLAYFDGRDLRRCC